MRNIDAAEKLLRIALFSDSLQLTAADDRTNSLVRTREELARSVRVGRKKGVIQVFLSEALFVIALAISIYGAFNEIGSNQTAHELGIGLLLSWLPVLVLSSTTDRNPVAADEIRQQLNNLLDLVRTALLDADRRGSYIKTIGKSEKEFTWTKYLEVDHKSFFTAFAGQGRVRWHVRNLDFLITAAFLTTHQHGCACSILASIEHAWMADHGRGWLDNADNARTRIISDVEPDHQDLVWFNRQMFWQIAGSTAIFYGTTAGAFILACENSTHETSCQLLLIHLRLHSHCGPRLLVWRLYYLYRHCYRHFCNGDVAMVVSSDISECAAVDPPLHEEFSFRKLYVRPVWTCTTHLRSAKQRSLGD